MEFSSLSCIISTAIICPISYGCIYCNIFGFTCIKPNRCCLDYFKICNTQNAQVFPMTEAFVIVPILNTENISIIKSKVDTNKEDENFNNTGIIITYATPINI